MSSGNVYYIPIICCGQPMAEVYDGDKRVAATCAICKKVWNPPTDTTIRFSYRSVWAVKKTDGDYDMSLLPKMKEDEDDQP